MNEEKIQELALERFPVFLRKWQDEKGQEQSVDVLYGDRQIWIEGFKKAIEILNA